MAERVDGGGIAVFAGEIGQHGAEHFRLNGRGGVVIEIDALHGARSRIGLGLAEGKDGP